jgi:predicted DNA-binding antitoxin AbrB/MazE fold protein
MSTIVTGMFRKPLERLRLSMSTTIEAVYERGVLRLSRPIDLADGTRVEVVVIAPHLALAPVGPSEPGPKKKTPAEILAEIAAMPMESSLEGFSGEDHDQVLYGGDEPR